MSTTSDQQKQDEFLEWLKTEHELHRVLYDSRNALESIYRHYFELGLGHSPERAATKAKTALEIGFPVKIKTGRGELRAVVNPAHSLIDVYFNFLKNQLGLDLAKFSDYDSIATKANDKQKKAAKYYCTLYLINFVNRLQQELWGTMEEVSQMATIESAKQMGTDLNLRQMIERLSKATDKRRKRDAGVIRGGARPRAGFKWNTAKKIAFYKMVTQTPVKNGKTIWEFACGFLIEEGFESETVSWLLTRPGFENVDRGLFNEAVNRWKKYVDRDDIVDDQDKPRFFEYKQALITLEFPLNFKFSTLDNYFFTGKRAT